MLSIYKYQSKIISDIFVTGYLEESENGIYFFKPLYDRVYFEIDNKIHEISVSEEGKITSKEVEKISPWFEVDEDDMFSISSVYIQTFRTEEPATIKKIEIQKSILAPLKVEVELIGVKYELELDAHNIFGFSFSLREH